MKDFSTNKFTLFKYFSLADSVDLNRLLLKISASSAKSAGEQIFSN